MHTLACPLPVFRRALAHLAGNRSKEIELQVGTACVDSRFVWLVRETAHHHAGQQDLALAVFLLAVHEDPAHRRAWLASQWDPSSVVGRLSLSPDRSRPTILGAVRTPGGSHPLDMLLLTGAGMRALPCRELNADARQEAQVAYTIETGGHLSGEHWRRTIGALGSEDVWRRMVSLRIGVVGCGRTGSLVAMQLAQLGARHLLLIDEDRLEPHNLGEMVGVRNVGEAKVIAVSRLLRNIVPEPGLITPVVHSVRAADAIAAAKTCDVLFCAVDNDAARLLVTFIATFHHKVLVDIGTGVFDRTHRRVPRGVNLGPSRVGMQDGGPYDRVMGADVRIVLPGDGCLRCRGGFADYDGAMRELCGLPPKVDAALGSGGDRAGSLLSLNAMATSIGIQMLQDLVSDRLQASTWAHLEYDQRGHVSVQYPTVGGRESCPICARAGIGDEGI